MKIGIVGATGQVGGVIARLLDDRHLPIDELRLFASAPGRVFSRDQLLQHAYADERIVTDRTVDTHIKNLRMKIEADPKQPKIIVTVFGVGYRYGGKV